MKKSLTTLLLLALAITAAAQTDLYQRYASRTDIRVASVNKFAIDSATTIGVTRLEAEDFEAWASLCNDFGFPAPSESGNTVVKDQSAPKLNSWDGVMFAQRNSLDPTQPIAVVNETIDPSQTCYIGVSYLDHTIYIFYCQNAQQANAVLSHLINKMLASGGKK